MMNCYTPLYLGEKYTIAKKKKSLTVVNDGICGYYLWDSYKDAKMACAIINKCKITDKIIFKTKKDSSFFEQAETDYSEFASYLLAKIG